MDTLKLGMLNCQGIKEKINTPEFQNMVRSEDIFGVCETWLYDKKEPIKVPGFNYYPSNRAKGERGGLGVFIRLEIKKFVKIREDISTEDILWCKVEKDYLNLKDDLYIGVVYVPPETSSREKRLKTDHFKGTGGGPEVKIMIFFVLPYVVVLVMRILKWAHTPSNSRRLSFCGSWREAATRSFFGKIGENEPKKSPKVN